MSTHAARLSTAALLALAIPAPPAVAQCFEWDTSAPLLGSLASNMFPVANFVAFETCPTGGLDPHIGGMRWNGTSWRAVGTGVAAPRGLAAYDFGGGPRLFAGNATASNSPAVWDGVAWTPVAGVTGTAGAVLVHDFGGGPLLYAGGNFTDASGVHHVATWDGTTWTPLGGTIDGVVSGLAVFDDGSGPALFASGNFTQPSTDVAKWNGTSWLPFAPVVAAPNAHVDVLAVYDDGSGPALYASGFIQSIVAR